MVVFVVLAIGLVGALGRSFVLPTGASARAPLQFSGEVEYPARECLAGGAHARPLPYARVLLRDVFGRNALTSLDTNGEFSVEFAATPPVRAFVVLEDRRIFVEPKSALAGPYMIPLGVLKAGQRHHFLLSGAGRAGAANIFAVIDQAARVAASASPVSLPPLRVTWRYEEDLKRWMGDGGSVPQFVRRFLLNAPAIHVGSMAQAYWDWDLMHEYGHYVLYRLSGQIGPNVKHHATDTWPNQPLVPWSEGFGDGFASIASDDPTPTRDCASLEGIDIASPPAKPPPDKPQFAQYNEIAIAGVLWHLAAYLDPSDRGKGLAPILVALHAHPAQNMREFRDALVEAGLESTADEHGAIDRIFAGQRIAWGFTAFVTPDNAYCGGLRDACGTQLSISGPYGCTQDYSVTSPYPLTGAPFQWDGSGAPGPLPYTWQSDCLMSSFNGQGGILFPYHPGHSGESEQPFVLSVRTGCSGSGPGSQPCPATIPSGPAFVQFGLWGDNSIPASDGLTGPNTIGLYNFYETLPGADMAPQNGLPKDAFQLPVGQSVQFAEFWPDGRCKVLLPKPVDCQH